MTRQAQFDGDPSRTTASEKGPVLSPQLKLVRLWIASGHVADAAHQFSLFKRSEEAKKDFDTWYPVQQELVAATGAVFDRILREPLSMQDVGHAVKLFRSLPDGYPAMWDSRTRIRKAFYTIRKERMEDSEGDLVYAQYPEMDEWPEIFVQVQNHGGPIALEGVRKTTTSRRSFASENPEAKRIFVEPVDFCRKLQSLGQYSLLSEVRLQRFGGSEEQKNQLAAILLDACLKSDPNKLLQNFSEFETVFAAMEPDKKQEILLSLVPSHALELVTFLPETAWTPTLRQAVFGRLLPQNTKSNAETLFQHKKNLGMSPEQLSQVIEQLIHHQSEKLFAAVNEGIIDVAAYPHLIEALIAAYPGIVLYNAEALHITGEQRSMALTAEVVHKLRKVPNEFDLESAIELCSVHDVPVDWTKLAPTPEGSPAVDVAVYESARSMPSRFLRTRVFRVLPEKVVRQNPEQPREELCAAVPAFIYGLCDLLNPRPDGFLRAAQELYQHTKRLQKGGSRLRERFEYAATLILTEGSNDRPQLGNELGVIAQRSATTEEFYASVEALALRTTAHEQQSHRGRTVIGGDIVPGYAMREGEQSAEYVSRLHAEVMDHFRSLLEIPQLRTEDLLRVQEEWGDIRALVILASKYRAGYPEGMPLLRAATQAILENRWAEFRYDMSNRTIADQLKGLSAPQREAWMKNVQPVALENRRIENADESEKQAEVRKQLLFGLEQGHISSSQHAETQSTWATVANQFALNALRGEAGYQLEDVSDAKIAVGLHQFQQTTFGAEQEYTQEDIEMFHASVAHQIAQIEQLPVPKKHQKDALEKSRAGLRWAEERLRLGDRYAQLLDQLSISKDTPADDLKEIRTGLVLASGIVKLSQLSAEELISKKIHIGAGGKKDEDLQTWMQRLQAEFATRGSAFAQDIENAARVLQWESRAPLQLEGLQIAEEDGAQALFEVGRYPEGARSCQNYEGDVDYNKCLLAYATDADKKLYTIRKEDGTMLARSMMKLVYVDGSTPALFIEPTYTGIPGAREFFDEALNQYAQQKAKEMGGIAVLRGKLDGDVSVVVRASRNNYQYEDGGKDEGPVQVGLGVMEGEFTMSAYRIAA